MKSKIKILFTVFLCSISSILIAQSVNIYMATSIAKNHLATISKPSLKSTSSKGKSFQFTSVKATVENNDTLYYILNDTINKGFVIVSADKRVWPILAYSIEGSFNETKQPEAFTAWMENRKQEIATIKQNNLQPDSATSASWQNLSLKSTAIETTSVEPLIQTQWDQGCYYNSLCPADETGPCGHTVTGCTITAMAQIMKYWNFPTKGIGSHSYEHPTYGNLSADFGSTTYQWNQMSNQVTSPNDAVATLMYHCGVSLDAEYGPNATGAWDPRDELVQYFDYSSTAMLVNRDGFTTNDWIQLLKSELDLGHPIWYTGSGGLVAHSFICDGYQDGDYFHFNWGWSGSSDGYFYIGNLNPGWWGFNENQSALLNLVPGNLPDGYNGFFLSVNSIGLDPKGGTTAVDVCSSANWTAASNQSWLSLSTNTGGSGKTTLILTATENNTGNDRIATVTISSPEFSDQSITVNQFAKANVTPGGLQNLIAKNATSITKLTLSGTIDARDFKTMRDAMPALTDVDLSNVTIVAYTGNEGTVLGSQIYLANEIPNSAFYIPPCRGQNLIKSVILPTKITSIGACALGNSKYLTTINIPSSVTDIGLLAFGLCSALINVDSNNLNYSSIDGVLFNKDRTTIIQCPFSQTGNYSIPPSVTSIGIHAFEYCSGLTGITIPPSVTSIGSYAFSECRGLTTVFISSSVTSIGSYAFSECRGLTTVFIPSSVTSIENQAFQNLNALINVDANNPNYSSIDGVLFNKIKTKLIQCPISKKGIYTIPASVTTIGLYAFSNCSGLTNVAFPSSVSSIENYAFNKCSGLTNITLPSTITSIEYGTFSFCNGLRIVIIPSAVISIKNTAFSDCSKLDSIFAYFISPVNLSSSPGVFDNVNKNTCILYVPYGSKTSFQAADQWKNFVNIVEMPGIFLSNNSIGMGSNTSTAQIAISSSLNWTAASNQPWLTISPTNGSAGSNTMIFSATENSAKAIRTATVTISATGLASQVITITQYGKVEVTAGNLKTILTGQLSSIISLTLTGTIDARDFKTMRDEMPALTDIDLSGVTIAAYTGPDGPDKYTTYYLANGIPDNAFFDSHNPFQGKSGLNSIILPSSVTYVGEYAFCECRGLTNINIPPLVVSIGARAFEKCTHLTKINIPSSVTSIRMEAFHFFNGLINVDANNKKYSSIDGVLFNKAQTELIQCPISKTGSYIIPSSVTSVGSLAFEDCTGLSKVIIPSSVISIGNSTFFNCTGLTTLEISSSLTSIGTFAFYNCNGLSNLTIPSSVTTIESSAFSNCSKLDSIFAYSISPVNLNSSNGVFYNMDKNTCILNVPYGSMAAYQSANQWKDFTNIVEMLGFRLSATTANVKANQGSTCSIDISSNVACSVSSNQSWLKASLSSSSGTNSITFEATENPEKVYRSAIVTVSAEGIESQTITITQEAKNTTGIDQLSKTSEFKVYPNPTNGMIKLIFERIPLSGILVTIEDISGKNCIKQMVNENEVLLDLRGNAPGIYFIKTDQENLKAQKVILK